MKILKTLKVLEKKEEISPVDENSSPVAESAGPKYFAALAGFSASTLADGKKMLSRLKARGFDVQMVERASESPKGQSHIWHQIITAPYSDKEELQQVVA